MSHEIYDNDNIVYAVERPWHGLGVKVDEVLTASEAILKADLAWEVKPLPVYDNEGREIKTHRAITRMDTGEVLNVMTDRYRPVQNVEAFRMVDEIVGTGLAKYDVAGTLRGGRILFLTVRLPYDFSLFGGRDEVRSYLNFITSHDGSFALQAMESPVRTVCMNTVRAAISSSTAKVYAKHTVSGKANFTARGIRVLEKTRCYFEAYKNYAEGLARKQMTALELDSFLDSLLNIEEGAEVSGRTRNIKEEITRLHEVGRGSDMARGTAWGAYNAVTEYVDHFRATKGSEDNRLASALIGSGAHMRERAFELLTVR